MGELTHADIMQQIEDSMEANLASYRGRKLGLEEVLARDLATEFYLEARDNLHKLITAHKG